MVSYRRCFIKGGSYFFTVALHDRRKSLLTEHIDLLRGAFKRVTQENSFEIQAIVILPEHLHCIWQLPLGDNDYPRRWRKIKSYFTRAVGEKGIFIPRNARGECFLWQRRYWEHAIRNEKDFQNHVNYIHFNPVKHGYVKSVCDWPYSSFHSYINKGLLEADWGKDISEYMNKGFGE